MFEAARYNYMVVYPKGNRELLDTAYVIDYREDEFDLASRKRFETDEEAQAYARELSGKHGLELSFNVPKYLDE